MPASLRDVRVVSPAVNLPWLQFTAILDATRKALKSAGNLNVNGARRHRAPALLDRRGCSPACPESWRAHRRATALQAICGTASAAVIERQ